MKIKASLNNYRRSVKKTKETAQLIKGLDVKEAIVQLDQVLRKDAVEIKKLILSAMANAENNFRLDKENLYVSGIMVQEGPTMKRWRPRAHGRAARILKRTCNINLILDERVEGKTSKKKEVTPNAKVAEEKKEEKKEAIGKQEDKGTAFGNEAAKKIGKSAVVGKKIFRRKSV